MAKNNPFREKNNGLKSKKGIKNYAWITSILILICTVLGFVLTKKVVSAYIGGGLLSLNLSGVAGVFYKNTKSSKMLLCMILLIALACLCLFMSFYSVELL